MVMAAVLLNIVNIYVSADHWCNDININYLKYNDQSLPFNIKDNLTYFYSFSWHPGLFDVHTLIFT